MYRTEYWSWTIKCKNVTRWEELRLKLQGIIHSNLEARCRLLYYSYSCCFKIGNPILNPGIESRWKKAGYPGIRKSRDWHHYSIIYILHNMYSIPYSTFLLFALLSSHLNWNSHSDFTWNNHVMYFQFPRISQIPSHASDLSVSVNGTYFITENSSLLSICKYTNRILILIPFHPRSGLGGLCQVERGRMSPLFQFSIIMHKTFSLLPYPKSPPAENVK
jgi:hypothetical protein